MTIPVIALNVRSSEYAKLSQLAATVSGSMLDNPSFPFPAVSIADMNAAATQLDNMRALWGPVHSRGSHENLVNVRTAAAVLHQLLRAQAAYVQSTAAILAATNFVAMAAIIAGSGFEMKRSRQRQGVLNKVQNFRFMASGALNRNQVKMVWDRPLEVTSPINVKGNNVYRSLTPNFADAVFMETVSKSEFIDSNRTDGMVTYIYFVRALSVRGEGSVSDAITITLLPA